MRRRISTSSALYQVDLIAALFSGFIVVWLTTSADTTTFMEGTEPVYVALQISRHYENEAGLLVPIDTVNHCAPDRIVQRFSKAFAEPRPCKLNGVPQKLLTSSRYDYDSQKKFADLLAAEYAGQSTDPLPVAIVKAVTVPTIEFNFKTKPISLGDFLFKLDTTPQNLGGSVFDTGTTPLGPIARALSDLADELVGRGQRDPLAHFPRLNSPGEATIYSLEPGTISSDLDHAEIDYDARSVGRLLRFQYVPAGSDIATFGYVTFLASSDDHTWTKDTITLCFSTEKDKGFCLVGDRTADDHTPVKLTRSQG